MMKGLYTSTRNRLLLACKVLAMLWCFGGNANAQSLHETYQLGLQQLAVGNFTQAQSTLERVIFFADPESPYLKDGYASLALCYRINREFKRAADTYEYAYRVSTDTLQQFALILQKAECLMLSQRQLEAQRELYYLPDALPTEYRLRQMQLLGMIAIDQDRTEEARKLWLQSFELLGQQPPDSLEKTWKKLGRNWVRKGKLTRAMSQVIPGSGQMALGRFGEGLNSFIVCNGLLTLAMFIAIQYSIIDAFVTIVPWYQRYYVGGIQGVDRIIHDKKHNLKNRVIRAWATQ